MEAKNVRLLMINGVGPVMGILQSENADHMVIGHPVQFTADENNDVNLQDYLQGIQSTAVPTIFNKSCICSVGIPEEHFVKPYVATVQKLTKSDTPKLVLPDSKIIVK